MPVAALCRFWFAVFTASMVAGCSVISEPVTEPQVAGFVMRLSAESPDQAEPLTAPLSVEGAVERALRFNPTIRARELEAALSEAKVRAQSMSMLPGLIGEVDYYRRDRPLLSHSNQSAGYSSSSDLRTVSKDIRLSWNILDFGLALVRTRQGLDKARQQELEMQRVASRIVEETRTVFWRAAAYQHLAPEIERQEREIDRALALAKRAGADPEVDPTTAINLQRDILNLQRELNQLRTSLAGSNEQLAQSIGAPQNVNLRLVARRDTIPISLPRSQADEDIRVALTQRPEIRQHLYDMRITHDEIDATILQLLPGVTFSRSYASDTNSFLYHSNWISWGTRMAGNLLNLARLPADLDVVDMQHAVHRQTAVATAATIAMQVHVARARMAVQQRASRDANRFETVQRDLVAQTRAAVKTGRAGEQVLVREKLALLLAETRAMVAFADFHAAAAAYATALGDNPLPHAREAEPAQGMLAVLRTTFSGVN